MRTFAQLRCGLFRGHLPVTISSRFQLQTRCYLCDAPLGRGWDYRDLGARAATTARRGRIRRVARGLFGGTAA